MTTLDRDYIEAVSLPTVRQLDQITESLYEIGGDNLLGVYLHGSLALRCFQPGRSDLDLLVLLLRPSTPRQRRSCAQLLLPLSGAPTPIEISFLHRRQIEPWHSPTPFDFHFSETWRAVIARDLASGDWQHWGEAEQTDGDLAAHFTVAQRRGMTLWQAHNAPPLPQPPWSDYLRSITDDLLWARRQLAENGTGSGSGKAGYLILNACRAWAAVSDRLVLSKAEGAAWAAPRLPPQLATVVAAALAVYTGEAGEDAAISSEAALAAADWIAEQIGIRRGMRSAGMAPRLQRDPTTADLMPVLQK